MKTRMKIDNAEPIVLEEEENKKKHEFVVVSGTMTLNREDFNSIETEDWVTEVELKSKE